MMRFCYVGPEDQVSIFGATFPRGEPVEVSDPAVAHKLSRHPEFAPADNEARADAESNEEAISADPQGPDNGNAATASRARRRRNS